MWLRPRTKASLSTLSRLKKCLAISDFADATDVASPQDTCKSSGATFSMTSTENMLHTSIFEGIRMVLRVG